MEMDDSAGALGTLLGLAKLFGKFGLKAVTKACPLCQPMLFLDIKFDMATVPTPYMACWPACAEQGC